MSRCRRPTRRYGNNRMESDHRPVNGGYGCHCRGPARLPTVWRRFRTSKQLKSYGTGKCSKSRGRTCTGKIGFWFHTVPAVPLPSLRASQGRHPASRRMDIMATRNSSQGLPSSSPLRRSTDRVRTGNPYRNTSVEEDRRGCEHARFHPRLAYSSGSGQPCRANRAITFPTMQSVKRLARRIGIARQGTQLRPTSILPLFRCQRRRGIANQCPVHTGPRQPRSRMDFSSFVRARYAANHSPARRIRPSNSPLRPGMV